MKSKKIQLTVPEYLSIEEYQKIYAYTPETEIEFLVNVICAFSGLTVEEVRQWSVGSLAEAANQIVNIANVTGEFYPIVEFNGTVYGYAQIEKASLGEFIDLETYSKETIPNLHKIASILYRPITKHKFGTWKWDIKSAWKQAKNQVENPLNYYTVEEYNSDICFDREEEFKQFPVHLILGALTFFLSVMLLSQNNTLYSMEVLNQDQKTILEKMVLEGLSDSIGGGLLYSISYPKQESFLFRGPDLSLN